MVLADQLAIQLSEPPDLASFTGFLFVIRMERVDWDMVLFGAIPFAVGIYMMIAPVSFATLLSLLNRGGPGQLIPQMDSERVARSASLRGQIRVNGALIAGFGGLYVSGGLGLL